MLPILNRAGARSLVFPVAVRDLEKKSGDATAAAVSAAMVTAAMVTVAMVTVAMVTVEIVRMSRSELFPIPKTRCV